MISYSDINTAYVMNPVILKLDYKVIYITTPLKADGWPYVKHKLA